MPVYLRPRTLDEALGLLADPNLVRADAPLGRLTVLAGATDFYPARAKATAWGRPMPDDVLDISALPGLDRIEHTAGATRIGALVTWGALRAPPLPPAFEGVRAAAAQVGGRQVQNRGTVVGNLCNASPAADGVPPLLTLDATVELASRRGVRHVPLAEFVLGNRCTALAPDELATAILVPHAGPGARGAFLKLGARAYLVISAVMVAGVIEVVAGRVAAIRLAVGACSAVATRLPALEAALHDQPADPSLAARLRPEHLAALTPIEDVRGSVAYRTEAALVLVRRLLTDLATPALARAA